MKYPDEHTLSEENKGIIIMDVRGKMEEERYCTSRCWISIRGGKILGLSF